MMVQQVVKQAVGPTAAGMASMDLGAFASACGNLAPWACAAVFLSPVPTIQGISKDKSVGNLPLIPYTSMISNCFLWSVYGLLKREPKIYVINSLGFVLGLGYFFGFVRHSPKSSPTLPGSIRQHLQAMMAIIAVTTLIATAVPDVKLACSIIGLAGVFFAIALSASPLAALNTVLEKKSARDIPLPFALAALINGFLWGVYGLFKMKDINVYLPNILGCICAMAQVTLKLKFGNGPPALAM